MRKALPRVDYSGMSQRSQARVHEPARDGPFSSGPSVNSQTGAKVDSVAEYAARLVSLRRVNIDSPGDAEFVREPADVGAPRLVRQRHLDPAAFGSVLKILVRRALSVPLNTIAMLLSTLAG